MVKTKIKNSFEDKTTQTSSFWVDYPSPNRRNERLWSFPMPYPQFNIQAQVESEVKEKVFFNFHPQYFMQPFVNEQMCCTSFPWYNMAYPEDSGESRKCPYCKQGFKNAKGLNQHVGKMHMRDDRNVVCTVCSSAFKNQHALKLHIKQVHEKITRVTCPYCEKKMYNKYVLSKHIEKKHRQFP
jgi:uncharacterized Zn-finger protein